MSISKYVDEVRRGHHGQAGLLGKDISDLRRDHQACNSIIATLHISFEHIRKQTPTAARLLSLMSMFGQQGIPESLLHDRYKGDEDERADFDDDIHTLTSYFLVNISADGRRFEMFQLVQFSTIKWLELSNELEQWEEMYTTLMDSIGQSQVLARSQTPHTYQALESSPHIATTVQSPINVFEGADLQIPDRNMLPYRVISTLGMGGSASVQMVQDTTTGQLFAHKLFRTYHGSNLKRFRQEIQNEIKIMRRLSFHPHIIRLFATYSCNRDFGMILTPVADEGDLANYLLKISDSGAPPTMENRAILLCAFGCLANGLSFIHKHTIRHKDIKPQNILIHLGRIVYTDFGIAFDATESDSTTTTGRPNAFTRRYCAPEVAIWDKRNRKSDVFSLGCVFTEILAVLEPPLHSQSLEAAAYYEIVDKLRKDLSHKRLISPHWSGLISVCISMLEPDPNHRISADTLLNELNTLERFMSRPIYFCNLCFKGV
ncbi:kinase-like domain-containing protein [Phaeosphaeriaceae sp. PMI808]|nr:kinase-like domain-containing protein [Phaeosphaeriaceae sp. PMI808]